MLLVVAREEGVAGNAQIVAVRVTPYSSRCHQKLFAIVSLLLSLVQSLRERGKERARARVCMCSERGHRSRRRRRRRGCLMILEHARLVCRWSSSSSSYSVKFHRTAGV